VQDPDIDLSVALREAKRSRRKATIIKITDNEFLPPLNMPGGVVLNIGRV
jgi:hypothetical protein